MFLRRTIVRIRRTIVRIRRTIVRIRRARLPLDLLFSDSRGRRGLLVVVGTQLERKCGGQHPVRY